MMNLNNFAYVDFFVYSRKQRSYVRITIILLFMCIFAYKIILLFSANVYNIKNLKSDNDCTFAILTNNNNYIYLIPFLNKG